MAFTDNNYASKGLNNLLFSKSNLFYAKDLLWLPDSRIIWITEKNSPHPLNILPLYKDKADGLQCIAIRSPEPTTKSKLFGFSDLLSKDPVADQLGVLEAFTKAFPDTAEFKVFYPLANTVKKVVNYFVFVEND